MLEVIHGETQGRTLANNLSSVLNDATVEGTLYIGYPVLANADKKIVVDALLVSERHGLVGFLFSDLSDRKDWEELQNDQDRLYVAIKTYLMRHDKLRDKRELGIQIQTVTVFPTQPQTPAGVEGYFRAIDDLPSLIESFPKPRPNLMRPLQAALQRVTTIKPVKKRENLTKPASRGSKLKQIEAEIANLDQWQKRGAIESPEGPQRIRGLAGSGKTVVLALKAAYLHSQHPEWKIAVTFHSRALYQQFEDLIRRFCYDTINDEPNWENLRVRHAWGGSNRSGIYTEMARITGSTPRDFLYGSTLFGRDEAFFGVCNELLSVIRATPPEPLYDAILIDEAQDLPWPFFRLVFQFTKDPKRIVWAYDELQMLSESVMPSTSEMFGKDENGDPLLHLNNAEGSPKQDVMLPTCYRNTHWALTMAHALGLGLYRKEGLVQHFDDPTFWREIGYRVMDGWLKQGQDVTLERSPDSFPSYFPDLLAQEDAVFYRVFADEVEQAEWVAFNVKRNLDEDELEVDDILIIIPDAYMAGSKAAVVIEALARHGLTGHLVGVTNSRDRVFVANSIAIANIYRSKGNEAPMVYVLDCQYCYSGYELKKIRNILFTAVTRSRAWVRLCGWGMEMEDFVKEMIKVVENNYKLSFRIPTQQELEKMRKIHRDRTAEERRKIEEHEKHLKEFVQAFHNGDIVLENLPHELRVRLAGVLKSDWAVNHDAE